MNETSHAVQYAMAGFYKKLAEVRLAKMQEQAQQIERLKQAVVMEVKASNHWFREAQKVRGGLK